MEKDYYATMICSALFILFIMVASIMSIIPASVTEWKLANKNLHPAYCNVIL